MDYKLSEWMWRMWQWTCNKHGTKKKIILSPWQDLNLWPPKHPRVAPSRELPGEQGHVKGLPQYIWHFWHVTYFSVLFPSVQWYLVGQESRRSSHLIQLNFSLCIKMLLYFTNSEYIIIRVFQVITCRDAILFLPLQTQGSRGMQRI